jgi:hypothetical protein
MVDKSAEIMVLQTKKIKKGLVWHQPLSAAQ